MSRAVMQQALEALVAAYQGKDKTGQVTEAITALRAALAEPEQEPVAWMDREGDVYKELPTPHWCPPHTPLYAHPPIPRKPLKEDEIADLWDGHTVPVFGKIGINPIVFARAIERAHGIGDSNGS